LAIGVNDTTGTASGRVQMTSHAPSTVPRVRVVVVNSDGGEVTMRCLESLRRLDWPRDALDVVVVDNASIDGLVSLLQTEAPDIRVIESLTNTGHAGGCNQALRDLSGVDYVALLNHDAVVTRDWLHPLVDALEADPALGAANSKVLVDSPYVGFTIDTPTFEPPKQDDRSELGVRISGIELDGGPGNLIADASFDGAYGVESGPTEEPLFRWTRGHVEVRIPFAPDAQAPRVVRVRLAAEAPKVVMVGTDEATSECKVAPEPAWFEVPLGPPYEILDNAGSLLVADGRAPGRGSLQRDVGQYDEPAEIFAWCGAAVLLSTRFLRDVGIFDDRFYSRYEDADLSWRGRLAGWRYTYVPESIVRKKRADDDSSDFSHLEDRNRLLVLVRNAPMPLVRDALSEYRKEVARVVRRDVLAPLRAGARPRTKTVKQQARALAGFGRRLPGVLVSRRRVRKKRSVDDVEILQGMVDR